MKPPQCPLTEDECKGYELRRKINLEGDDVMMVTHCSRQPCPATDPAAWLRTIPRPADTG